MLETSGLLLTENKDGSKQIKPKKLSLIQFILLFDFFVHLILYDILPMSYFR